MLVLSRKLNEALEMTIPAGTLLLQDLRIGVKIVRITDTIRIGIEAPAAVRVLRAELLEEKEGTP